MAAPGWAQRRGRAPSAHQQHPAAPKPSWLTAGPAPFPPQLPPLMEKGPVPGGSRDTGTVLLWGWHLGGTQQGRKGPRAQPRGAAKVTGQLWGLLSGRGDPLSPLGDSAGRAGRVPGRAAAVPAGHGHAGHRGRAGLGLKAMVRLPRVGWGLAGAVVLSSISWSSLGGCPGCPGSGRGRAPLLPLGTGRTRLGTG